MEITWLGHACFRLRGREVTILTDPYGGSDWGYAPLSVSADVVTVWHDEPHHANLDAVGGQPRILRGPGEYEIGGAMIWGVATHRRVGPEGKERSRNTAYVIQLEDLTVCHLGDLGFPPGAEQLAQLKNADVLLVPVGGHCTIGGAEAAEIVANIEPTIIVPMHFATPETEGALVLDTIERFCREMGATGLTPQPRLNVSAGNLPAEPTVVLLEQRG